MSLTDLFVAFLVSFFNCVYSRNFIPLALRSVCLKELSKSYHCHDLLNGSVAFERIRELDLILIFLSLKSEHHLP